MMESFAKVLFDFDKLPARLVLVVCFLSGTILFVPAEFLEKLKLNNFNDAYGQWVGIAFLGSAAFLAVSCVTYIGTWRKRKRQKQENKAHYEELEATITKDLKRLDPTEQSVLREFYLVGSTVKLPMDNPTVVGLQDKRIIRLAQSNLGSSYLVTGDFELPFRLTDFARTVIESDISLIGLPVITGGQLTQQQIQKLSESRPPWTRRGFGY